MKLALALLALAFATATYATGGKTDSKGCHNSKKQGYHCHGSAKHAAPAPKPAAKGNTNAIPKVDKAPAGRKDQPKQ